MQELFTIGHSNHPIEHVLELLDMHRISAVAAVRSTPYSEYLPQFNREPLQYVLRNTDIDYVFLGKELGVRRTEERCYVNGQAKYDRIKDLPAFRLGLDRLIEGIDQYQISLMCSEADPIACHRTILVCREMHRLHPDIAITHILADGRLESREEADERLIALHKLQPELFGDLTSMDGLVEKAYDLQAEKSAYRKTDGAA